MLVSGVAHGSPLSTARHCSALESLVGSSLTVSCVLKHSAAHSMELCNGRHHVTIYASIKNLTPGRAFWFQVEPGGRQELLSASADGSLALWDLRCLGPKAKALATAGHSYTCQSAYFAPDGALIHQLIVGGLPSLP